MAKESKEPLEERAKSSTSPEELEKLAEDKDEYVRGGVAGNTSTPVSVLEKLAEDKNEDVRTAVAENENTSTSVLKKKTAIDDKAKALLVASYEN